MRSHRNSVTALGVIAVVVFFLLIGISFGTARLTDKSGQNIHSLIVNLAFSLLSIAGTVLVVDRLNEARDAEEERNRLFRDMSASDKAIAQRGARELAELGALTDGSLRGRDLSGAGLYDAQLEGLIITGGKLIGTHLEDADLTRSDLSACTLNSAYLREATLENAKLVSAQCVNTDFAGADMNAADMSNGNFQGASFENADLERAVLILGDYTGANFKGAKLSGAKALGARFDATFATRFGMGNFRPEGNVYVCQLETLSAN